MECCDFQALESLICINKFHPLFGGVFYELFNQELALSKEHIELLEKVRNKLINSDETRSFYICRHAEILACTMEELIAYEDIRNTLNAIFKGIVGGDNWREFGLYAVTNSYLGDRLPPQTLRAGRIFRLEVLAALVEDFRDVPLGGI